MKFIVERIHVNRVVLYKDFDYKEITSTSRIYNIIITKFSSTVTIECFEGEEIINKISTMFNIDISDIELDDFTNN